MRLVGTHEVCGMFDCTRAQIGRWREQDFPAPVADLKAGPVWDAVEVEAWRQDRAARKRQGVELKRLTALRAYRRIGSVAGAGRETGYDESTIRRWLKDLNEPLPSQLRDHGA